VEPTGLFGDVSVDVPHELRQLLSVVDDQQQVGVVREDLEVDDADPVEPGRPSDHSDDDVVQILGRPKEVAPLDRPGRHLDQGVLRDEAG